MKISLNPTKLQLLHRLVWKYNYYNTVQKNEWKWSEMLKIIFIISRQVWRLFSRLTKWRELYSLHRMWVKSPSECIFIYLMYEHARARVSWIQETNLLLTQWTVEHNSPNDYGPGVLGVWHYDPIGRYNIPKWNEI